MGLGGAIDLDGDELTALGLTDVGKVASVLAVGITSSSYNGGVRPGKILFDEATAEALSIDD